MFPFTSRCHCDLLAQNVYHPLVINLMEGMRTLENYFTKISLSL